MGVNGSLEGGGGVGDARQFSDRFQPTMEAEVLSDGKPKPPIPTGSTHDQEFGTLRSSPRRIEEKIGGFWAASHGRIYDSGATE
jgi:hypothetical protein